MSSKKHKTKSHSKSQNKSHSKHKKSNNNHNNSMLKLKNPNQVMVGFCVVCKKKGSVMRDCSFILNKHNGAVRVSGFCKKCGTKMNTFMARDNFL